MALRTKILIVDDHPLLRKGLALSLGEESGLEVVGQAADAEEALAAFEGLDPDLAIVDISLPGMSGIELIKHFVALKPELQVIVVSRHDEMLYAERAIRAGAKGYVMKLEAADNIVQADPARPARRHLPLARSSRTASCSARRPGGRAPLAVPAPGALGPRARGVRDDGPRSGHARDRRAAPPLREDGRELPRADQAEAEHRDGHGAA
jgi:CheY-like chemotaxis protein